MRYRLIEPLSPMTVFVSLTVLITVMMLGGFVMGVSLDAGIADPNGGRLIMLLWIGVEMVLLVRYAIFVVRNPRLC